MADLEALRAPLPIHKIEFRVQSINKGGYATILAYKDARVDMERLDAVVGALNWKRMHTRDNKNCVVSIYNDVTGEWVSKEDTGTESNTEAEKGLASDSFKRACFNWGIGRELYDYPVIQVKLNQDEFEEKEWQGKKRISATWNLRLREWVWYGEFEDGALSFLSAIDNHGRERFVWGTKSASVVAQNAASIETIKTAIASDNLSTAAEAWFELDDAVKEALWVAPSKGGCFTTQEREIMKSKEFRVAYYGDK